MLTPPTFATKRLVVVIAVDTLATHADWAESVVVRVRDVVTTLVPPTVAALSPYSMYASSETAQRETLLLLLLLLE